MFRILQWNWYCSSKQLSVACIFKFHLHGFHHDPVIFLLIVDATAYINRKHDVMMTSANGTIFRVTGHLCGEFTGQWRGALMFSLICARTNSWANKVDAGDLRRHRAHYDVIVTEVIINHLRMLHAGSTHAFSFVNEPCTFFVIFFIGEIMNWLVVWKRSPGNDGPYVRGIGVGVELK